MTGIVPRVELIHAYFISSFETASGRCGDKETVLLTFEEGDEWELTWSPSMGVSPKTIYKMIIGEEDGNHNVQRFVSNHLRWREVYKSDNTIEQRQCFRGEELGVTESATPTIHKDIDLLKLKCRRGIPRWLISAELPARVICDFNGSAGSVQELEEQLRELEFKHSKTKFYLEQPFKNVRRPEVSGIGYVHDRPDYHDAIKKGEIRRGDIAVIKFGRNSVDEFEELHSNGINVSIGSVLSLDQSYDIVRQMNRRFSTFRVNPIYRDGQKIDKTWKWVNKIYVVESHSMSRLDANNSKVQLSPH